MIDNAWAQAAAAPDPTTNLIFIGGVFVIMYLLMIRPQMKKQKQQRNMISALQKGDEVLTNGGLVGQIECLEEDFLLLKLSNTTTVQVQRQAISTLLPKGTVKFEKATILIEESASDTSEAEA